MAPSDQPALSQMSEVARELFQRIGLKVNYQAMDWSTLIQRRASKAPPAQGGWNIFLTNATATGVENPLVNNFVKNCAEAWYHWACDQRIVDLNRQWALETEPAKRKQITDELQRVHLENVTLVPLGMYRPTIIYRKELTDIIPAPAIFYWNVKKRGGA